jgi:UDP-N-acetylmuramate dehydrogenase
LEEFIARLRRQVQGDVLLNEPLHRYTSFRLGGPADVLVHPSSMDDVIAVQQLSSRYEVPVTVLGAGSNVLIADAGVRGVVVRIGRSMSAVAFDGETIVADCGAPFPRLGKLSVEQGLTGLEFASGIPGTLGGALYMNAGAHNQTTAAVVEEVTAVDGTGRVLTLTAADMEFGYRSSRLQRKPGSSPCAPSCGCKPRIPRKCGNGCAPLWSGGAVHNPLARRTPAAYLRIRRVISPAGSSKRRAAKA